MSPFLSPMVPLAPLPDRPFAPFPDMAANCQRTVKVLGGCATAGRAFFCVLSWKLLAKRLWQKFPSVFRSNLHPQGSGAQPRFTTELFRQSPLAAWLPQFVSPSHRRRKARLHRTIQSRRATKADCAKPRDRRPVQDSHTCS